MGQSIKINDGYIDPSAIGTIYFNANTDRTVVENRANAIRAVWTDALQMLFKTIRYSGGYYYNYIGFGQYPGQVYVYEHDPYAGQITIWYGTDRYNIAPAGRIPIENL